MKKILQYLAFIAIAIPSESYGMDNNNPQSNNPLNAQWFYDEKNPCFKANMLLQDQRYQEAALLYNELLKNPLLSNYDKAMVDINYASCQLAGKKGALQWKAFDHFCGIPDKRQIKGDILNQKPGTTFIVQTKHIGIGDIVHFLKAIKEIPEVIESAKVYLIARKFLHNMLEGPSKAYNFQLIEEQDANKIEGTEVHLISLLGYFGIEPNELSPEKVIYTADEEAVADVKKLLDPLEHEGKEPCPVFIGENRQATLMGGKQLTHDPKKWGRNLKAEAFQKLLKKRPKIVLIDCNPESSCIKFAQDDKDQGYLTMSSEFKDRVVRIPSEKGKSFSSLIALALYSNAKELKDEELIGFGADNGPANVFTRALSSNAQDSFSFIVPGEYDVRMEGEGTSYKHMLSNCNVYRCKNPEDLEDVIIQAYEDNRPLVVTI